MIQTQPAPAAPRPAFLHALDNVLDTDTGWIADCPHWGCGAALQIEPGPTFICDAGCAHEDIVDYLRPDTGTDQRDTRKLWRALMLAPNLEVLEALLQGQPVPRSRLDPTWARRFGL